MSRRADIELEVRQDDRFQAREWRVERIGWLLMSFFVIAGLIGALGNGPLSWATARSNDGLVEVEYQRVAHHEADDSITLVFAPQAVEGDIVKVALLGSWVSGVDRQGLSPQPANETLVPGGVLLELPAEPGGSTSLTVSFRAQKYGPLSAEVVVGGDRASFTQFVLP